MASTTDVKDITSEVTNSPNPITELQEQTGNVSVNPSEKKKRSKFDRTEAQKAATQRMLEGRDKYRAWKQTQNKEERQEWKEEKEVKWSSMLDNRFDEFEKKLISMFEKPIDKFMSKKEAKKMRETLNEAIETNTKAEDNSEEEELRSTKESSTPTTTTTTKKRKNEDRASENKRGKFSAFF